ncbi:hypothetical protein PTTG_27151 [Puccinia triticina 1-1 BBBD Race 1]|uniref:Uncharacterized protein n=1 Tax=Puccinia triticina (isolate 1-1 / race 1 (BBBD)) TaxID=630390 RepID=A0A180GPN5_PUCT1|nr:hypothetical protein PTTG_27151 [Puccinia triticina 1-1 BBBD Race 1]
MTNKAIHRLPILTRTTFDDWRNVMFSFCLEKGVDEHLLSDLVTGERDPIAKSTLKLQKGVAAGILGRNLGVENYAKFITEENKKQPHLIWTALTDHFQSKFNLTLEQFLTDIDVGLSRVWSVGIQIVKMEKQTLDEHLLAEYLVNLLPSKLEGTKDLLLNKSPIDIDTVKQFLNSKYLSLNAENSSSASEGVIIKSENALNSVVATCENVKLLSTSSE